MTRILLADDDPDVRDYVANVLGTLPHASIREVSSGEAAIAAIREEAFDLIVTDERMGAVDGVKVLNEARVLAPHARLVMITAFPDFRLLERAVNGAHVAKFLSKPFSPEQLLDAVVPLLTA